MSERTEQEKEARRAIVYMWRSLLETFGIVGHARSADVLQVLKKMPKHRVICFQYVLRGAGYHTENFKPDGVIGQETKDSIEMLYEAVGRPGG